MAYQLMIFKKKYIQTTRNKNVDQTKSESDSKLQTDGSNVKDKKGINRMTIKRQRTPGNDK